MSLNKVLLIGNAGRDPEVRHLESGVVTATFSLATTEKFRDRTSGEMKEQTEWHNIVCWTQLFIEGRIRTRSYNDSNGNTKYVTEIVADNMQLLGRKSDNPAAQGQTSRPSTYQQQPYQQPYQQPAYQATAQPVQPAQPMPAEDMPADEIGDDLPF